MRLLAFAAALLTGGAMLPEAAVNQSAVIASAPPAVLSGYGFFAGSLDQPAGTLIAYRLRTPLFSDYAEKRRFIHIPAGATITISADGTVKLPVGSAIIKSFGYPDDAGKMQTLETRVMLHQAAGWAALPYVTRPDGRDADLKVAGRRMDVAMYTASGEAKTISYAVPNKNQCKECHGLNGAIEPIGLDIADMEFVSPDDARKFAAHIPLTVPVPMSGTSPVWNDPATGSLDARARTYLRINCAHCHRPGGSASNSGLYFSRGDNGPRADGIWKRPVAAGRGSGNLDFDINPGRPDASILLYRMNSLEPGIAMPEVGRALVHDEGVELVTQWIAAMPVTRQ